MVSIKAVLDGAMDISLGNVVGSNIANIGLILAIAVILRPVMLTRDFYLKDAPMMVFSSLLLYFLFFRDKYLDRYDGGFMLLCFLIFLFLSIRKGLRENNNGEFDEDLVTIGIYKTILYFVIGSVSLWAGGEMLIQGSISLAKSLGVSERIISISLISIGTSIPELATSIAGIIKKENALSVGNLIGSNIFNILVVLGITVVVKPIELLNMNMLDDYIWMLIISSMVIPLTIIPKKMVLGRKKGIILLVLYSYFIISVLM
ncbi:sodium/calcium exchanger [Ichthyobacterium seriolicida]|uniref:Sodium/calcium exchanger n=2 Tax=Ichthyobacterium seriolicida TaxID=242600 RepID=A0A1J1DXC1_9FLAO|nr:sodium/calcium exchanger [Ichthyobacterium seriolicida]